MEGLRIHLSGYSSISFSRDTFPNIYAPASPPKSLVSNEELSSRVLPLPLSYTSTVLMNTYLPVLSPRASLTRRMSPFS